jgi:hypothetical protein
MTELTGTAPNLEKEIEVKYLASHGSPANYSDRVDVTGAGHFQQFSINFPSVAV